MRLKPKEEFGHTKALLAAIQLVGLQDGDGCRH